MHRQLFLLGLVASTTVSTYSINSPCKEVQIPISVSVPRFYINTSIHDNWDAVSLTFNLTRRDSGSHDAPLPIAGLTDALIESNYSIGATLCTRGRGGTVLVLTHGIIESKLYWRPNFEGAEKYSFVDAALAAGYSILSYDRIGVGSSSTVDALWDAQFQVEAAVLNSLAHYARESVTASKVALVGHSYGAYLSAASANATLVDAVILSGFSGSFEYFAPFLSGAGLRVAQLEDPKRWGHLDSAYLTSADLFTETYIYFAGDFDRKVAKWSYEVATEPFAVGELPSLLAVYNNFNNVTAPVLIIQGQYDVSACGGNCVGILDEDVLKQKLFNNAKIVKSIDNLPAGHDLNLHTVAPVAFQTIFDFLKTQGV